MTRSTTFHRRALAGICCLKHILGRVPLEADRHHCSYTPLPRPVSQRPTPTFDATIADTMAITTTAFTATVAAARPLTPRSCCNCRRCHGRHHGSRRYCYLHGPRRCSLRRHDHRHGICRRGHRSSRRHVRCSHGRRCHNRCHLLMPWPVTVSVWPPKWPEATSSSPVASRARARRAARIELRATI